MEFESKVKVKYERVNTRHREPSVFGFTGIFERGRWRERRSGEDDRRLAQ